MKPFLDEAENLLRAVLQCLDLPTAVFQSRDVPTLVLLHHLCDLAKVLDNLKLSDECRLTGNCALELAEDLVRRSPEFGNEQAKTLAFIAGLSVYQPSARDFFIRAVSICERLVADDASNSNKAHLLVVLYRAGEWTHDDPALCVQWLGLALRLMNEYERPSTMVVGYFFGNLYYSYGNGLSRLGQYDQSIEAYQEALSIYRTLAKGHPGKYIHKLAQILQSMGKSFDCLEKYQDAVVAYLEAIGFLRAMSAQDPLLCNAVLAYTLHTCASALFNASPPRISDAAKLEKEAVSLFRDLAETQGASPDDLCACLHSYGFYCQWLEQYAEAVIAYQELIRLWGAWANGPTVSLVVALYYMANSLDALGRSTEANAAARKAREMGVGIMKGICLLYPPYFVCRESIPCESLILPATSSSPLPPSAFLADVREHSESGVSIFCIQRPTKAPSDILLTNNTAHLLERGHPVVASDPSAHPISTVSSSSCPAPNHPQIQELRISGTHTTKPTGEIVKVSKSRKRDMFLRLFKKN